MMNLRKLIFLMLLAGFVRPASATAADNESFGHHGFYFGAGGTWAFHLFQNKLQNVTSQQVDLTQSYGANARIGYRLLSWFSTELEYEWLNGFKAKTGGQEVMVLKGQNLTGNLKFHIVPVGPIQPNLCVGFGEMQYRVADQLGLGLTQQQWAFASRLGGGLDIYLTKHFLINGEATVILTTNDITSPTTLKSLTGMYYLSTQAGFQYRF